MKKALYRFIEENIMFLLLPSIGIILAIILLTVSFLLYEGGAVSATAYYAKEDRSILSAGLKSNDDLLLSKNILNWDDGEKAVEKLSDAEDLIIVSESLGFLSSNTCSTQVKAMGVNHSYWNIVNEKILFGRLINNEDTNFYRSVIVINEKASLELFNTRDAIGETVNIEVGGEKRKLTVIGVLKAPFYFEESICFFSYNLFSPDSYDKSWISIVVPQNLKNDNKDKLSKVLYDKYGADIYETHEYNQLMQISYWLDKYIKTLCILLITFTVFGMTSFVFGLDNYLRKHLEKLIVLKAFGVKDDKIKMRLFNKLSLHGLFIIFISLALGYLIALILGGVIFIKPVLLLKDLAIIISFGCFCMFISIMISLERLKTHNIL